MENCKFTGDLKIYLLIDGLRINKHGNFSNVQLPEFLILFIVFAVSFAWEISNFRIQDAKTGWIFLPDAFSTVSQSQVWWMNAITSDSDMSWSVLPLESPNITWIHRVNRIPDLDPNNVLVEKIEGPFWYTIYWYLLLLTYSLLEGTRIFSSTWLWFTGDITW